mmetsp:Transcript_3208/g.11200  ORF Transcript_3208/g.11200 Transcript_3208/m.11200 type:complete len:266 (-) Transcript_3208:3208-4005(-)
MSVTRHNKSSLDVSRELNSANSDTVRVRHGHKSATTVDDRNLGRNEFSEVVGCEPSWKASGGARGRAAATARLRLAGGRSHLLGLAATVLAADGATLGAATFEVEEGCLLVVGVFDELGSTTKVVGEADDDLVELAVELALFVAVTEGVADGVSAWEGVAVTVSDGEGVAVAKGVPDRVGVCVGDAVADGDFVTLGEGVEEVELDRDGEVVALTDGVAVSSGDRVLVGLLVADLVEVAVGDCVFDGVAPAEREAVCEDVGLAVSE